MSRESYSDEEQAGSNSSERHCRVILFDGPSQIRVGPFALKLPDTAEAESLGRPLAQLPQFGWQVFCCQWGYVEVFTTSLQIRCGQGFAGRGIEAGLLDGLWGG
jgi:hypothetical protein